MKPLEAVAGAYDRIGERGLHPIWISLVPREQALARARELEEHPDPKSLPLFGMTFAAKDNIDVAGVPTTAGCPAFAYTPQCSATVIRRLEAAGAICIGKTNLDQFATGLVGVRSPYGACSSAVDGRYISGGSSSGSAVAVALGQVDFSLGTDTAGSGRVPAAFNGLVGMKPTRGLLSTAGVVPACRTLDCVSIFAGSAGRAQRVLNAAAGFDAGDPYSRTGSKAAPWLAAGLRIGVPRADRLEFFGDTDAASLYQDAIVRAAADLSAEVVEIDYTPFRDAANLLYAGPWVAERLAVLRDFLASYSDEVHPVVRRIVQNAECYTAVDAFEASYKLAAYRRAAEAEWRKMDVLLLPTAGTVYTIEAVEADPVRLNTNLGYYTNFVNLMDLAAVAVPAGVRPNGLPFGVSFIGPAFTDHALLELARRWDGAPPASHIPGCVKVAVAGAHLTGQPLNHQLTSRGARLWKQCRTAPCYRLYSLDGTKPPKPGVVRSPSFEGSGIEIEVWAMPEEQFGGFVAEAPPPLAIGSVETDSGEWVKGFVCEPAAVAGAEEITHFGGWRAWMASQGNRH